MTCCNHFARQDYKECLCGFVLNFLPTMKIFFSYNLSKKSTPLGAEVYEFHHVHIVIIDQLPHIFD